MQDSGFRIEVTRRTAYFAALLILMLLSLAASTAINLSDTNRTSGLLPQARGGTGAATTAAGTVFGRSYLAGTGAPSFIASSLAGSVPFPSIGRFTIENATGTTSTIYGDTFTFVCSVGTNAAATSTLPSYAQCATSTVNGNVASISGNTNYVVGRNLRWQKHYALSSTVTRRDWWGLTNQTSATMGASDDPAGYYASFGYSTSRGGTDYDCITKDNVTQELKNSGITVDTNFHQFEIVETVGVNFLFYIDGALVCTNNTNLPASGTPLRYSDSTTCLTCTPTAVNFKRDFTYVQSDF